MLLEQKNEKSRFERIFSPRTAVEFLIFFIATIIINQVSSLVGTSGSWINIVSIILFAALFTLWFVFDKRRAKRLSQKLEIILEKEKPEQAPGLIWNSPRLCLVG